MNFYEVKDTKKIEYLLVWENNNKTAMIADQGERIEVFEDWDSFQKRFEVLFCGDREFKTSRFVFACKAGSHYEPIEYEVITKIRLGAV